MTMFIQRQLCFSLLFVSLAWGAAAAQGQTATTAQRPGPEFNIIINRQSVRFASPTQAREWQIEVYNQTGELVFASGNLLSAELDWPLLDQSGKPVESGLYAYTLTLKDQTDGSRHVQRGHVIVDRASAADRVWVTSSQHAGVGADNEATKVTVVGSHESTVGGAELPATAPPREESASNREVDASSKDRTESLIRSTASISGSGITNRITKWTDGPNGMVGNSALTEVNGLVGLGTSTPDRHLTVQSNSAAYLNVKANSGTHEVLLGADSNGGIVSTMTNHDLQLRAGGNSTKMTIKANGNVGLGTLSPANQLSVAGSADIAGWFGIGTTRPTLPLHIEGTMAPMRMVDKKPSGRNWVFSTGHNIAGDFVFLDATSNSNVWQVLPGYTDASGAIVNGAFVVENRNVGIGTSNPQAKLDVAGTVRAEGNVGCVPPV
jgi:hypothetical protein